LETVFGKPVDNEYIFFGVEKAYRMAPFSKQVFKNTHVVGQSQIRFKSQGSFDIFE
jgi:hypothetical protein